MDIHQRLTLLGGLSADQFMRRHWQRKPLLIRQAIASFRPLLTRGELFALAASEDVESRLLEQGAAGWKLRRGPFSRRALPPLQRSHWTLLVQGVDLHHDGVHALMQQFRFVPDARLDDVMISFATDGGGVGPHFDSYDVFLLQAHGRRRWRIGRQKQRDLVEGLPLKILADFQPEEEHVLEPGDMLYLPPGWAHDGIAEGECMTYSIGFRQPARGELARELLAGASELAEDDPGADRHYQDRGQAAVAEPARVPEAMLDFARDAVMRAVQQPRRLSMLLGELLTEPKPQVWFDGASADGVGAMLVLDRRTRMMYDAHHVFINGESYRASGKDARWLRKLADERQLSASEYQRLGAAAREIVGQWIEAGWAHGR